MEISELIDSSRVFAREMASSLKRAQMRAAEENNRDVEDKKEFLFYCHKAENS